jgi:hypothetical protein
MIEETHHLHKLAFWSQPNHLDFLLNNITSLLLADSIRLPRWSTFTGIPPFTSSRAHSSVVQAKFSIEPTSYLSYASSSYNWKR